MCSAKMRIQTTKIGMGSGKDNIQFKVVTDGPRVAAVWQTKQSRKGQISRYHEKLEEILHRFAYFERRFV